MSKPSATDAAPVDRRVLRTRHGLRTALMSLMTERGWDALDVQALCDRADIGRSTFYQHYANKEELLQQSFAGLRDALWAHAAGVGDDRPLAFVPALLDHVHEFDDLFRALIGRRSGHYVQDRFRELLLDLVRADPALNRQSPKGWRADARAHVFAGALFELMVWWLSSNRPQRPAEIHALYEAWIRAVLSASSDGHAGSAGA